MRLVTKVEMAEYRVRWIPYKSNEDAAGLTARERERDMSLHYHSPETTSGLEEVENTRTNVAHYYNPCGDTK
jgi:hypothetical protein